MKKVLNYILLTAVLGTFLPYSALAQTTDVGVNITGSVSIDVVTTISANITLDLTTGETTPTYMEIQNNSSVPVNAKITNISTTSEGAPSTFVRQYDKSWNHLSKDETSTYVNFNILGEGQNVAPKDILANTEVNLGVLSANIDIGGFGCGEYPCYIPTDPNQKIFEINANFGRNWDEGDKNFTYQITTVYSQAESYVDPTLSYTYPTIEGSPQIKYLKLVDFTSDLSKFEYTIEPSPNYNGKYYVFEVGVENGMGSATTAESAMVLYNKKGSTGLYNLMHDGEGTRANVTIDLGNAYGLLVPEYEDVISETEDKYYTLNFEIRNVVWDEVDNSYSFVQSDQKYNYTYIIKLVNN